MSKRAAVLCFSILLFFLFVFGSNEVNRKSQSAGANPTPDSSAVIESVALDKNSVWLSCPWNQYCSKEAAAVKVTTVVKNAEKNDLTYYYVVSDGHIIGEGANVVWSFEAAREGKHTITVGLGSDSIIRGKTVTKTIEALECTSCHEPPKPCACPALSVSGPAKGFKAGDSIIFTASAEGGTQIFTKYQWSVSSGTIINGQGASQIIVKTNSDETADVLAATVEISGYGLCDECPRTTSKSVSRLSKKP
jgi:hypothetical protein